MTTAVKGMVFEDIVSDVKPMKHWQCMACYPKGHSKPKALCGVFLLGVDPDPEADMCDDCEELHIPHFSEHLVDW